MINLSMKKTKYKYEINIVKLFSDNANLFNYYLFHFQIKLYMFVFVKNC